ncbi:peptidase M19 [Rhodovulum sulfidophilum]|uniref:Dipeptidase n=1 Tax=Rhodovulum visakhapatnamense TaxID=364297 RepID=A0A4V3GU42_9RHOB|nr:dipeptidase [Rhodovulum visakhapatnamense]MBL3568116.1 dipeptidase [Rhodovulum visakhapatnamense]MBL3578647.1 dipeptidase [Rhodovulum visakhapatnamense]OLS45349.1 peptidase M19 [Rhodovulum sulfidophilum]TDX29309.1 membrane dipeptidase [Rhodovulum visakhapatnamense]
MDPKTLPAVFDGHNDVLLRLYRAGGPAAAETFLTGDAGHIDLPKARAGGLGGGFFAVYVPSEGGEDNEEAMAQDSYDLPLPPPEPQDRALTVAMAQVATLERLEELGALKICRSAAEIHISMVEHKLAAILHMEGAEAIDPEMITLDVLHGAGLRSLGPVWSRPTIFGEGVPFRYPSDGDTGGGLTDLGVALVRRCNALKIMIDLSHMTMAGFWDVARQSDAPLVATHSNAHAICPHARNLTDAQLEAIAASDGMVGLNYATAFLRPDGRMIDTGLDDMLRHLDHLLGKLGETRVGLGSDFDGAMIPSAIGSAAGLPALRAAMTAHGYGPELIERICHGNWLRVLEKTWGH